MDVQACRTSLCVCRGFVVHITMLASCISECSQYSQYAEYESRVCLGVTKYGWQGFADMCRRALSLSASFIFTLIIQFHHQCQHWVWHMIVWLLGTCWIGHQCPNWKRTSWKGTSWPGPIIILGHKEVGETDACSCGYGGQKVVVWHIISAQATSTNLCTVSQLSQWYGEWRRTLSWINSFELG